jgi:hypothetical protein
LTGLRLSVLQRLEAILLRGHDEAAKGYADELLVRHTQQFRKPQIAIDNRSVGAQCGRALLHLLDQHAIRTLGAFKRVDPAAFLVLHDEGIDCAIVYGPQRFLGLFEAPAQFGVFLLQLVYRHSGLCIGSPPGPSRLPIE